MNLDADTLDALGYGDAWEAMAPGVAELETRERAANTERKREQRWRDPEHQRRLAREAQRAARARRKAADPEAERERNREKARRRRDRLKAERREVA